MFELEVGSGIVVTLGENYEALKSRLDKQKLEYIMPKEVIEGDGKIQVVILLRESGLELQVEDGIVRYIRTSSHISNNAIFDIPDIVLGGGNMLKEIKEGVARYLGIGVEGVRVSSFSKQSCGASLMVNIPSLGEVKMVIGPIPSGKMVIQTLTLLSSPTPTNSQSKPQSLQVNT